MTTSWIPFLVLEALFEQLPIFTDGIDWVVGFLDG